MLKMRDAGQLGLAGLLFASAWLTMSSHHSSGKQATDSETAAQLQKQQQQSVADGATDVGQRSADGLASVTDPFDSLPLRATAADPSGLAAKLQSTPPGDAQRQPGDVATARAFEPSRDVVTSGQSNFNLGEFYVENSEATEGGYVEYLVRAALRGDSARATGADVVAVARAVSPDVASLSGSLHFSVQPGDDLDSLSRDAIRVRLRGGQTFEPSMLRWSLTVTPKVALAPAPPIAESSRNEEEENQDPDEEATPPPRSPTGPAAPGAA